MKDKTRNEPQGIHLAKAAGQLFEPRTSDRAAICLFDALGLPTHVNEMIMTSGADPRLNALMAKISVESDVGGAFDPAVVEMDDAGVVSGYARETPPSLSSQDKGRAIDLFDARLARSGFPTSTGSKSARRIFSSSGEKRRTVSAIVHAIRGASVPRTERPNYA